MTTCNDVFHNQASFTKARLTLALPPLLTKPSQVISGSTSSLSGVTQTQSKVKKPGPLSLLRSLSILHFSVPLPAGAVGLKRDCLLPDSSPCWAQRGLGVEAPPTLLLAPFVISRRFCLRRKNKDQKVNRTRVGVLLLRIAACEGDRVIVSVHTAYRLQDFQRRGHAYAKGPEFHTAPRDSQHSCFLFTSMRALPAIFLFVLVVFGS